MSLDVQQRIAQIQKEERELLEKRKEDKLLAPEAAARYTLGKYRNAQSRSNSLQDYKAFQLDLKLVVKDAVSLAILPLKDSHRNLENRFKVIEMQISSIE